MQPKLVSTFDKHKSAGYIGNIIFQLNLTPFELILQKFIDIIMNLPFFGKEVKK